MAQDCVQHKHRERHKPRLLTLEEAADYCGGIAAETFEAHVHVAPVRIGTRKLWDIKTLDHWLDQQSGLAETRHSADYYLAELANDSARARR
jgi:hypothetical protein